MAMHGQACACRLLLPIVCCAALHAAAIAAVSPAVRAVRRVSSGPLKLELEIHEMVQPADHRPCICLARCQASLLSRGVIMAQLLAQSKRDAGARYISVR